jgi:threonine/homoserine/homoserine lactone efflux protein
MGQMIEVLSFGMTVVTVSASGVLAPGPLLFANLAYASRHDKWSGIKVSCGHTIVEVLLIMAISTGLFTIDAARKYSSVIGLMGGIAILTFAGLQIATLVKKRGLKYAISRIGGNQAPLIAGISFSALNPFFILWWFTAGLKLISDSAQFGVIVGLIILFTFHIWMDFAWLVLTAYLYSKGSSFLNSRLYRLMIFGLAMFLLYYGLNLVLLGVS